MKEKMKRFACWIGWHSWKYRILGHDGCSFKAQCLWCDYKGLLDSHGSLF